MENVTIPTYVLGIVIFLLVVIFDFVKKRQKGTTRFFFYSFLIYCIVVAQLTIGKISIPPYHPLPLRIQLTPFYFIQEWMTFTEFYSWAFFNNARLTFFNFLMLMPFGFYVAYLFNVKKVWKAILLLFTTSLLIETSQLVLSYFGFILLRGFNADDLIMNTLGGLFVYLVCRAIQKKGRERKSDSSKSN